MVRIVYRNKVSLRNQRKLQGLQKSLKLQKESNKKKWFIRFGGYYIIFLFLLVLGSKIRNMLTSEINPLYFFCLFTLPIVLGFTYIIKNLKISIHKAKSMEVMGYGLLFFALIWQFVILEIFKGTELAFDYKLDYIYWTLADQFHVDTSKHFFVKYLFTHNLDSYYGKTSFEAEETIGKVLFGVCYLVSTVLIAIGRFHEINVTQEPPHLRNKKVK